MDAVENKSKAEGFEILLTLMIGLFGGVWCYLYVEGGSVLNKLITALIFTVSTIVIGHMMARYVHDYIMEPDRGKYILKALAGPLFPFLFILMNCSSFLDVDFRKPIEIILILSCFTAAIFCLIVEGLWNKPFDEYVKQPDYNSNANGYQLRLYRLIGIRIKHWYWIFLLLGMLISKPFLFEKLNLSF